MVVIPASPPGFQIGSSRRVSQIGFPSEDHLEDVIEAALEATEVSTAQYLAYAKASVSPVSRMARTRRRAQHRNGHGVTYKSVAKFISGDDQPIVGV